MSSEQMPPEFEWIKPGARVLWLSQTYNVNSKPFLMRSAILDQAVWWVKLQQAKYAKRFSVPVSAISLEPITLTLTREQAELLANEDKVTFWKMTDWAIFGEIKKQIEEKLK